MRTRKPADLVRELRANSTDGAAVLARLAITMLRDYVGGAAPDDLHARTAAFARQLINARPDIPAIGNLVRCWEKSFAWPATGFRTSALEHCDAVLGRADRALEETIRNARRRLAALPVGCRVLTHSASSTVRATVSGLPIQLLVTASEPGGEGRRLAAEMGACCVPDDAAPAKVADVAAVLVGADGIDAEAFLNKVGTRVLAEAAQRAGTPFFVVAESYKWLPPTQSIAAAGAFEIVPNALVTAFLSDQTPGASLGS